MKPLVYLAGPITGQTLREAKDWRALAYDVLEERGIRAVDPLRGKEFLNSKVEADGVYRNLYDEHPMSAPQGLTNRDRWDAERCDLTLAFFPAGLKQVSIGTVMEIAWASSAGRYVLTVLADQENNPHEHAMLMQASSLVLGNLLEALELIPVILGVEA